MTPSSSTIQERLRQPLTIAVAIALLAGALLALAPTVVGSGAPDWQVGDTWHYRSKTSTDLTYTGPAFGMGVPPIRGTNVDDHWLRVVADDEDVNGHPVYTVARSGDGEVFYDAFHVSREDMSLVVELSEEACQDPELNATQACDQGWGRRYLLDFPLREDRSWRVLGPEFGDIDNTTAVVEAKEEIETRAGTVDAYRITLYDPDDPDDDPNAEYAYWYAPDVGWIVQESFELTLNNNVFKGQVTSDETLLGTSHEEDMPEHVDGVQAAIEASSHRVTYGTGQSIDLTAVAPEAPDHAVYRWWVGGQRLEGEQVTFTPSHPGAYPVKLVIAGASGTIADARTYVAVDLEETFAGTYDTFGEHAEYEVGPVGPGLATVSVDYQPAMEGVLHDPSDDVTVLDDDGDRVPTGRLVHIDTSDTPEAGDWAVEVDTGAQEAASGDYEVTLSVTYELPEEAAEMGAAASPADALSGIVGLDQATQANRLGAFLSAGSL